jgi:hypothetical protein
MVFLLFLWLWLWICYNQAIGLAIARAILSPSLFCATAPGLRQLLAYLSLLHKLNVCTGVMVAIGLTAKELLEH